jgi:hypothetical protein
MIFLVAVAALALAAELDYWPLELAFCRYQLSLALS